MKNLFNTMMIQHHIMLYQCTRGLMASLVNQAIFQINNLQA